MQHHHSTPTAQHRKPTLRTTELRSLAGHIRREVEAAINHTTQQLLPATIDGADRSCDVYVDTAMRLHTHTTCRDSDPLAASGTVHQLDLLGPARCLTCQPEPPLRPDDLTHDNLTQPHQFLQAATALHELLRRTHKLDARQGFNDPAWLSAALLVLHNQTTQLRTHLAADDLAVWQQTFRPFTRQLQQAHDELLPNTFHDTTWCGREPYRRAPNLWRRLTMRLPRHLAGSWHPTNTSLVLTRRPPSILTQVISHQSDDWATWMDVATTNMWLQQMADHHTHTETHQATLLPTPLARCTLAGQHSSPLDGTTVRQLTDHGGHIDPTTIDTITKTLEGDSDHTTYGRPMYGEQRLTQHITAICTALH